ncbi:MATE family efflux transporter [Salmonella enterica]|nr:MATE family efflux transporter [Salmonella enterica]
MLRIKMNAISVIKKLGFFSLPIIGTSFLNMLAGFIGLLFVAKIGSDELAASSLAVTSFVMIWTMSACLLYSVGILVGHCRGSNASKEETGNWVKNGIFLALVISLVLSLIIANFDKILLLFGQDKHLVMMTKGYFRYAACFLIPALVSMVLFQFFVGIGKPQITLITYTIRLPVVSALFYIFVLGKLGFSSMGLAGVAFSLFLVQIIECVSVMLYVHIASIFREYKITRNLWVINGTMCKTLLTIGGPIGVQFGGELAVITIITYMMGHFGSVALVANQIVSQFIVLSTMVTMGLTQALSVLVSQSSASGEFILIRRYYSVAQGLVLLFLSLILVAFIIRPNVFLGMYIDVSDVSNTSVISLSMMLFCIGISSVMVDGLRNLLSGVLRGLQDAKTPMIVSLLCLWGISLPISWLLAFPLQMGPVGLRIGFASGIVVASVILFRRYISSVRNKQENFELSVH